MRDALGTSPNWAGARSTLCGQALLEFAGTSLIYGAVMILAIHWLIDIWTRTYCKYAVFEFTLHHLAKSSQEDLSKSSQGGLPTGPRSFQLRRVLSPEGGILVKGEVSCGRRHEVLVLRDLESSQWEESP